MKAILQSRKTLALLLLLGVGVAKLPFEQSVSDDLRAQKLLESPPDLSLRESVGQMGFAASLGGLRSLVASITYLEAYTAFEEVDWGRVDSLMTLTTRLQPREPTYWEEASWHMAYNASTYYKRDESLLPIMREKLYHDYILRGLEILHEGLRYLPNEPRLYLRLGLIHKDKTQDHRQAADAFLAAYANGAQDYTERMAAYELTALNERSASEQAYEILKRYYDLGMKKQGTSIMRDLPILEQRLNIPQAQRVKGMADDDLPRYKLKMPRKNPLPSK